MSKDMDLMHFSFTCKPLLGTAGVLSIKYTLLVKSLFPPFTATASFIVYVLLALLELNETTSKVHILIPKLSSYMYYVNMPPCCIE